MIETTLGPVVIDPVEVAAFVASPGGPVVADLMRRGTRVQGGARALVRKRTRALEKSIVKRLEIRYDSPAVIVGSDLAYAIHEHNGTRPHVIRPRHRKALRFPAPGSTRSQYGVVFAMHVNHPGTQGTFFLTKALPLARD